MAGGSGLYLTLRITQPTLIGALWYRENEFIGATIDGVDYPGRWGTYSRLP